MNTGYADSQTIVIQRAWRIAMEQYFGKRQSLGNVIQTEAEADQLHAVVDHAEILDYPDALSDCKSNAFARHPQLFESIRPQLPRLGEDGKQAEWLEPDTLEQAVAVTYGQAELNVIEAYKAEQAALPENQRLAAWNCLGLALCVKQAKEAHR